MCAKVGEKKSEGFFKNLRGFSKTSEVFQGQGVAQMAREARRVQGGSRVSFSESVGAEAGSLRIAQLAVGSLAEPAVDLFCDA